MVRTTIWGKHPICNNYIISIDGEVRSITHTQNMKRKGVPYTRVRKGQELELKTTHKGYSRVQLGRVYGEKYVHRLVLETFIGIKPYPKYQCDHLNSEREDNRLENLEWVTQSTNMRRAHSWPKHLQGAPND